MQCFLRKLVMHHRHHSYNFFCNSHRVFQTHAYHTALSSLRKSSQLGHHISTSFITHPLQRFHSWRSHHTKIRGLFTDPLTVRKFTSVSRNALVRVSSRGFLGCRPKLHRAHFYGQSFDFNQSSDFYRRGWRSWFHRLTPNDVVLGLIITNVAVFFLWRIADEKFMIKNFTISLDNFKSGRLHTLITNAFSHIDTWHIISNMIGLYFFGMNIGRSFGPEFLVKLYLAGAVGGSIFYLVHQAYKAQRSKGWRLMNPSKELALGASGAVNAIMLLDIFLFPKATIYLEFFIPVPAILLGIFLIGKDMLRIIEGDTHISGSAHLGGAVVAAIAWARIRKGGRF